MDRIQEYEKPKIFEANTVDREIWKCLGLHKVTVSDKKVMECTCRNFLLYKCCTHTLIARHSLHFCEYKLQKEGEKEKNNNKKGRPRKRKFMIKDGESSEHPMILSRFHNVLGPELFEHAILGRGKRSRRPARR